SGDAQSHIDPRRACGRPGTRAPHVWLEWHGQRVSALDFYGRHFVLLAGPAATEVCRHGARIAVEVGIDFDILRPADADLGDPTGGFCAAHGIESDGCVLIRPDGFVAWRARNAEQATARPLRSVLLQLLGRGAG